MEKNPGVGCEIKSGRGRRGYDVSYMYIGSPQLVTSRKLILERTVEGLTTKDVFHSVSGAGTGAAIASKGDMGATAKSIVLDAVAMGSGIASAVNGYKFVSENCETFRLEKEDKEVTKSSAKVGAVAGTAGAIGTAVAGIAAGSVVAPICAVLFLPAAATISAGWLGHQLYQSSRGGK